MRRFSRSWIRMGVAAALLPLFSVPLGSAVATPLLTPPQFTPATLLNRADQTIQIDFRSSGCWHLFEYRFRFVPIPRPHFRVWENENPLKQNKPQWKELCPVTLTPEQVRYFDALMECYREPDLKPGSTTHDRITITQMEGNRSTFTRTYMDSNSRAIRREDAHPDDLQELGIRGGPVLSLRHVGSLARRGKRMKMPEIAYKPWQRKFTEANANVRREQAIRKSKQQTIAK